MNRNDKIENIGGLILLGHLVAAIITVILMIWFISILLGFKILLTLLLTMASTMLIVKLLTTG